MESGDFKDQSMEELQAFYEDSCKALFQVKSEKSLGMKLDKPHRVRTIRKDIARALTIMHQKRLAEKQSNS